MSPLNPENRECWNKLHVELKNTMQKEISLMRELLANLQQEELSQMLQDQGTYNQLMGQRFDMIERLGSLRIIRNEATKQIMLILEKEKKTSEIEQILPDNEEISCEILSLRDQLMALTEKMNRQQSRNQHLNAHPEYLHSLHRQAEVQQVRAKKKAMVATYHIKK